MDNPNTQTTSGKKTQNEDKNNTENNS